MRTEPHSISIQPNFDDRVNFTPNLRGVAWGRRGQSWCAIDRRDRLVPGIACADADPKGAIGSDFPCKVEP